MHKKVCGIVIMILLCLFALTSCGSSAKEYKFDNAITWNSTIDDVKAKYGTPDKEDSYVYPIGKQTDPFYSVNAFEYNDFTYRGIEDCKLTFRFTTDNKLLEYDAVTHHIFDKDYEKLFNELISEYGEPSVKEQNYGGLETYETIWDKQFSDTIVKLVHFKDTNGMSFTVKNATYTK